VVLRLFGVLGTRAIVVVCLLASSSVVVGAWRNLWLGARGVFVDGTVVRQDDVLTLDGPSDPGPGTDLDRPPARRQYRAVVAFTADGRTYFARARNIAVVHLYPLGSSQPIVFPPGRPELARLREELPEPWAQAAMLAASTIIAAGALQWWWWLAKRRPRFRRKHQTPARQDRDGLAGRQE